MARFEFQAMSLDGRRLGESVHCDTVAGIVLQCPTAMDARQIEHLCEIARVTPDYPVDICHWTGPGNDRRMAWSARLYYRSK